MVSHVYSKSQVLGSAALAAQASAVLGGRLLPALAAASAPAAPPPHGLDVHSLFCAAAADLVAAYCFGLARAPRLSGGPRPRRSAARRAHWQALYAARKANAFFAQELPRLSATALGGLLTPAWVRAANRELEAWNRRMSDAAVEDLEGEWGGEVDGDGERGAGDEEGDAGADAGAGGERGGRREGEEEGKRKRKKKRVRRPTTPGTADDPVVVRALLAGLDREAAAAAAAEAGTASPIHATTALASRRRRALTVASETIDHVLAGQETTGVALTYLSYHLSRSPGLQRELRAELLSSLAPNLRFREEGTGAGGGGEGERGREGQGEGREGEEANDGSGSGSGSRGTAAAAAGTGPGTGPGTFTIPDSRQLDGLPLLHAVVVETVRRYAPAGGPEPRVTPSPTCRIGPYGGLPGGVRVSASPYNLHRDEAVFPDPERWDHTRWLPRSSRSSGCRKDGGCGGGGGVDGEDKENEEGEEEDRERLRAVNRHFWGFSSGGRMCLGSNFAMHGSYIQRRLFPLPRSCPLILPPR